MSPTKDSRSCKQTSRYGIMSSPSFKTTFIKYFIFKGGTFVWCIKWATQFQVLTVVTWWEELYDEFNILLLDKLKHFYITFSLLLFLSCVTFKIYFFPIAETAIQGSLWLMNILGDAIRTANIELDPEETDWIRVQPVLQKQNIFIFLQEIGSGFSNIKT